MESLSSLEERTPMVKTSVTTQFRCVCVSACALTQVLNQTRVLVKKQNTC